MRLANNICKSVGKASGGGSWDSIRGVNRNIKFGLIYDKAKQRFCKAEY